ncbi:MAG TPA: NAD(P)(+) transhydrogenase (Re/Si-specific) subunit beta, partial [Nitrososphaerales archaeon]|nr:NAD(P)(+) transhydrogenase (Re/Si-specific) subunit beta [Nitrososphaerales archaeon]
MITQAIEVVYVAAAVLFALSLKLMSDPKTSTYGNWCGVLGMGLAVTATLLAYSIHRVDLLVGGVVIGALVG